MRQRSHGAGLLCEAAHAQRIRDLLFHMGNGGGAAGESKLNRAVGETARRKPPARMRGGRAAALAPPSEILLGASGLRPGLGLRAAF